MYSGGYGGTNGVTPYYDEDGITIYHGDCREVLPSLSGDVVLTDLPYAVGIDYASYEDTPDNLDELIKTTLPLMRDAAPLVAFTTGIANWWRYPRPDWVLAWYMSNAFAASTPWGFNAWQPVLVYGNDPYLARQKGRRPDVVVTAVPAKGQDRLLVADHPCPKPVEAWQKILMRVSPDESDVVIDPFMGSGSTLRSARNTGRRAIGIEIEEKYCEIAVQRLAQGVLEFG